MDTTKSNSRAVAYPSKQEDQMQKFGLDEQQMNRFGDILRVMNLEAIPTYASHVRQFGHRHTSNVSSETLRGSGSVPCKIVELPLCGSFHIVFTIEFDDGVRWMLKVSANGHRFDSVAAAALISEARTMQLIKSETTIPVPEVYAFDSSSCNELKTPFIMMERIDGQPLYRGWFDDEMPKARLEHFRIKVLQSLAEAMAQLNKFTLTRGGALEFDDGGRPVGLRGAKVVDAVAMYDREIASENQSGTKQQNADNHSHGGGQDGSHGNDGILDADSENKTHSKEDQGEKGERNDDHDDAYEDDQEDIFCEKGPFQCPKSAFLFDLDRSEAYSKSDGYLNGCYKALRMFIEMAFSSSNDRARHFVLTHPDLDVQNILVAEDGSLRGLIDWDGVASVPREIGCAQYPLWLMRDWVPFCYLYDIREGRTEEDAGYEESSPAELASYRAVYAHFMEKEIERLTGGPNQVTTFGTLPKQEAQLTRRSLVMRDLGLAASSPFLIPNILCHILHEIERVTEPEWKNMDLDMFSNPSSTISDTNIGTESTNGEQRLETETTKIGDIVSYSLAAKIRHRQANEGAAISERVLPQKMTKATDSSSGTQQPESGSQDSLELCQMETEEKEMESLVNPDARIDCSDSKPPRLGWARKLLCFSCNAAEKGLRRIAKIGHVLEDATEGVAEVLAEVELQCPDDTKIPNEGEPALGHRQTSGVHTSDAPEMERPEEVPSIQDISELELSRDSSTDDVTGELPSTLLSQDKLESDHTNALIPIPYAIKLEEIPARKAELIKREKARKKAKHRAEKAAKEEDLKIWEDIGLQVRALGISLEQLQMNQYKIFSCVVDALQTEEKQGEDLMADFEFLPIADIEERGAMRPEEEPAEVEPKEDVQKSPEPKTNVQSAVFKAATAKITDSKLHESKVPKDSSRKGPVTPPNGSELLIGKKQDKSESPTAKSSTIQPRAALHLSPNFDSSKRKGARKEDSKMVAVKDDQTSSRLERHQSSLSNLPAHTSVLNNLLSLSRLDLPPKEENLAGDSIFPRKTVNIDDEAVGATAKEKSSPPTLFQSTIEVKCQSGLFSSNTKSLGSFGTSCLRKKSLYGSKPEDMNGSLSPDSSVHDNDNVTSDKGKSKKSRKSSASSPSDSQMEVGMNVKATEDEDKENKPAVVETQIRVNGGHKDVPDELGANEAMNNTSSHNHTILAGDLGNGNGSKKACLLRTFHSRCSENPVELRKTDRLPTSGTSARPDSDKGATDTEIPVDYAKGFDTKDEDNAEDFPEDNKNIDSPSIQGSIDEDVRAFEDDGRFRSNNIFNLLGTDMLDEMRLLRMQEGFLKLLEQY